MNLGFGISGVHLFLNEKREVMDENIIEIEAETLEEAREQVKRQIPEGSCLLTELVISDGKPKTVRAIADATEDAFAKALQLTGLQPERFGKDAF